jgi:hypothetical protein
MLILKPQTASPTCPSLQFESSKYSPIPARIPLHYLTHYVHSKPPTPPFRVRLLPLG